MVANRIEHGDDKRMLIPRFSIRWLLAATAVCGLFAYGAAEAVRGQAWGIAVSITCGALVLTSVVFALTFVVSWSIARTATRARRSRATSPFASHVAPPQILLPDDPD